MSHWVYLCAYSLSLPFTPLSFALSVQPPICSAHLYLIASPSSTTWCAPNTHSAPIWVKVACQHVELMDFIPSMEHLIREWSKETVRKRCSMRNEQMTEKRRTEEITWDEQNIQECKYLSQHILATEVKNHLICRYVDIWKEPTSIRVWWQRLVEKSVSTKTRFSSSFTKTWLCSSFLSLWSNIFNFLFINVLLEL